MSSKLFTASPKRRQQREKRGNALHQMQDGTLENKPLKERWSREGKREAKRKKVIPLIEGVSKEQTEQALILSVHRCSCIVRLQNGEEIKAFYRAKTIEEFDEFPAVGDNVIINKSEQNINTYILKVLPRKSVLTRPGPRTRETQVLVQAANIDQVAIVMSLEDPPFNFGFADRFLLAASFNKLPFLLIINKYDLAAGNLLPSEIQEFSELANEVIFTSTTTKQGIELLTQKLKNKVSVFSGQSGVGKSSLINEIAPNANLITGSVRVKDGKGRHTTVASSYIDLAEGAVIDTPGIRSLGIMDLKANELARCFPGFFKNDFFDCKFKDCKHQTEPDCAVQTRIKKGEISPARYKSYLRILSSIK